MPSQAECPDHGHAVPLSDGYHVLFINNKDGVLCLGSDQPNGYTQRLSRKMIFASPAKVLLVDGSGVPSHYASTYDISHGVRVVASYGDEIVFYSVPVDVQKYSTAEQEQTLTDSALDCEGRDHVDILKHPMSVSRAVEESGFQYDRRQQLDTVNMAWVHYLRTEYRQLGSVWPLRLTGVRIGSFESVDSLTIHGNPAEGFTVWAISATRGMAKSWRVGDAHDSVQITEGL